MTAIGKQFTVDMYGCRREVLCDLESIQSAMVGAINAAGLILLSFSSQRCEESSGLNAVALLSGSHISIHTYPDLGFAAVDVFTCDPQSHPEKAITILKKSILPEKTRITLIKRGDFGSERDMKPRSKLSSGPIRRVKDTGSKVMQFLSRK